MPPVTTQSSGAAIIITGVSRTFSTGGAPVQAINDITVSIPAGSMVALTGASGSGKSTLLHLIGAIETADAGTIAVDGLEVTRLRGGQLARYRRTVGFVFQRYHLLPAHTALGNVMAPLIPYRTGFDKAARAAELLTAVGLGDRGRSLPAELSGGQQQRVAIARALAGRPRLLLADEPTGNLDSRTGEETLDLLADLRDRYGMTMLIATHESSVAARCDRMLRLRDGQLVEDADLTGGDSADQTMARVSGLRL
jgi:putative ABC transport system ATP-binding protein